MIRELLGCRRRRPRRARRAGDRRRTCSAAAVEPFDAAATAAITGLPAEQLALLVEAVRDAGRLAILSGTGSTMNPTANLGEWMAWALMVVTDSFDQPGGMWFNPGVFSRLDRFETLPRAAPHRAALGRAARHRPLRWRVAGGADPRRDRGRPAAGARRDRRQPDHGPARARAGRRGARGDRRARRDRRGAQRHVRSRHPRVRQRRPARAARCAVARTERERDVPAVHRAGRAAARRPPADVADARPHRGRASGSTRSVAATTRSRSLPTRCSPVSPAATASPRCARPAASTPSRHRSTAGCSRACPPERGSSPLSVWSRSSPSTGAAPAGAPDSLVLIPRRVVKRMNWQLFRDGDVPDVLIHPDDAAAAGVADGDQVEVVTATGTLTLLARVTDAVVAGAVVDRPRLRRGQREHDPRPPRARPAERHGAAVGRAGDGPPGGRSA